MIEDTPVKSDKPKDTIVIKDCGELPADAAVEDGKRSADDTGDGYESHPSGEFMYRRRRKELGNKLRFVCGQTMMRMYMIQP